jgi:Fur family peroxide stress response transcriptional regulator
LTKVGGSISYLDNDYLLIKNFSARKLEPYFNKLDAKERMDQMLSKLREHDCRITPQRVAVLRILAASEGHPSVESVYETVRREFPTTSIATVYKTVHLLKQLNEVLELGFPDGSNRYDGNKPFSHPHVICVRCQKIIDPDLGSLEDMTAKVADETGFDVLTHRLDFFGVCSECKKEKRVSKTEKEENIKKGPF